MTQLATGNATPHGATYDGHGVNFTLFSAHAERVELCVFDEQGCELRYDLPGRSGVHSLAHRIHIIHRARRGPRQA